MSDVAMSFHHPSIERATIARRTAPALAPSFVDLLLRLAVVMHSLALRARDAVATRVERVIERSRDDRGQATTEYALVLLAAALVALLLVAWATAGGGANRINRLFNRVIDAVIDRV